MTRRDFIALLLGKPHPLVCHACGRPAPPETRYCPYCDDLLPTYPVTLPTRLTFGGVALATTLLTVITAWPLPPCHLPATTLTGVALALGFALILTPLRWRGHTPASRYERRQQVIYRVGARWGTALAVTLTLYALHANARLASMAVLAALVLWWLAACLISRDARYGFLAGTLLGLATF